MPGLARGLFADAADLTDQRHSFASIFDEPRSARKMLSETTTDADRGFQFFRQGDRLSSGAQSGQTDIGFDVGEPDGLRLLRGGSAEVRGQTSAKERVALADMAGTGSDGLNSGSDDFFMRRHGTSSGTTVGSGVASAKRCVFDNDEDDVFLSYLKKCSSRFGSKGGEADKSEIQAPADAAGGITVETPASKAGSAAAEATGEGTNEAALQTVADGAGNAVMESPACGAKNLAVEATSSGAASLAIQADPGADDEQSQSKALPCSAKQLKPPAALASPGGEPVDAVGKPSQTSGRCDGGKKELPGPWAVLAMPKYAAASDMIIPGKSQGNAATCSVERDLYRSMAKRIRLEASKLLANIR